MTAEERARILFGFEPPRLSELSAVPKAKVASAAVPESAEDFDDPEDVDLEEEEALSEQDLELWRVDPTVLLGASKSAQHGLLGKDGRGLGVALDLAGCNTISLFGVQGFGKSYSLGVIAEMALQHIGGINKLPKPLATVMFHYNKSDAYEPELLSACFANEREAEIDVLLHEYGARATGLGDVVLICPEAKVDERREQYPGLLVEPIKFSSQELKGTGWKFLLGAYGNDALYMRQVSAILRRMRDDLTLDLLKEEIENTELSDPIRKLIEDRIRLAEPYIDDTRRLGDLLAPGRLILVDLRDAWVERDEALELFVVMMQIFADAKRSEAGDGQREDDFNRLIIFDEAHKYISEGAIIAHVVEAIREMRHHATSVIVASQDPLSVPRVVVELSTVLMLHRITSPAWIKHLKGAISALEPLDVRTVSGLVPGEALVWAQRSNDKRFSLEPQKILVRPRVTQHGGATKMATG